MKQIQSITAVCLVALTMLTAAPARAKGWKTERVNVENMAARRYMRTSNATFSQKEGVCGQTFFDEKFAYRPDQPTGRLLRFECTAPAARIQLSNSKHFSSLLLDKVILVKNGVGEYRLTNFIPGQKYYYRVKAGGKIILKGALLAEGQLRMIALEKGFNIRDLGGWTGQDGKHVRYGWLYRGGSLGGTDKDGNESTLPKADQEELHRIGIRAQLDLRAPTNKGKYAGEGSLHSYSLGRTTLLEADFMNIMTDYGAYNEDASVVEDVAWIIKKLKEGKPVYFNCRQGADRTGTIAFILEGLLGCYDHTTEAGGNQMAMDYELTGFSQANLVDNWRVPTSHRSAVEAYTNRHKLFRQILDLQLPQTAILPKGGNASGGSQFGSVQQKCYYYLSQAKDVRISTADLDWFINFMLEG